LREFCANFARFLRFLRTRFKKRDILLSCKKKIKEKFFILRTEGVNAMPEKRAKNGQFLPGTVNNPGGRPKENPEAKEILKAAIPDAARALVELLQSKTEKMRFMAAQAILDRTQGKPESMGRLEVRNIETPYNLDLLCKEELQVLEQILLKANDKPTGANA